MPMSYAYKKGSSTFSQHDVRSVWSLKLESTGSLADGGIDRIELLRDFHYEEHGWWMWGAWFLLGLALLVTKRYAKKFWFPMHFLHAFLGYFTLIVTIVFAFKVAKWEIPATLHEIVGWIVVVVAFFGSLSGMFTAGTMKFYKGDKLWTEKERVERVAKIHRYFGYLMLFVGNIGIFTGIEAYYHGKLESLTRDKWHVQHMLIWILCIVIFESIYRCRNKYSRG